jgi:hypothetical protein
MGVAPPTAVQHVGRMSILLLVALASPASAGETAEEAAHRRAGSELSGGLSLGGIGAGLGTLAGFIGGVGGPSDSRYPAAAIGIGVIGGASLLSGLELTIYAAGHRSGLRFSLLDDPTTRAALLERAERNARHEEIAGIVCVSVGAAFAVGGAVIAVEGVGNISFDYQPPGQSTGNGALFAVGIALAVLGDAAFVTGMLVWPHAAGLRRGLRESREALRLTPGGIAGRF